MPSQSPDCHQPLPRDRVNFLINLTPSLTNVTVKNARQIALVLASSSVGDKKPDMNFSPPVVNVSHIDVVSVVVGKDASATIKKAFILSPPFKMKNQKRVTEHTEQPKQLIMML